jgi:hypothetical protein
MLIWSLVPGFKDVSSTDEFTTLIFIMALHIWTLSPGKKRNTLGQLSFADVISSLIWGHESKDEELVGFSQKAIQNSLGEMK